MLPAGWGAPCIPLSLPPFLTARLPPPRSFPIQQQQQRGSCLLPAGSVSCLRAGAAWYNRCQGKCVSGPICRGCQPRTVLITSAVTPRVTRSPLRQLCSPRGQRPGRPAQRPPCIEIPRAPHAAGREWPVPPQSRPPRQQHRGPSTAAGTATCTGPSLRDERPWGGRDLRLHGELRDDRRHRHHPPRPASEGTVRGTVTTPECSTPGRAQGADGQPRPRIPLNCTPHPEEVPPAPDSTRAPGGHPDLQCETPPVPGLLLQRPAEPAPGAGRAQLGLWDP